MNFMVTQMYHRDSFFKLQLGQLSDSFLQNKGEVRE